MSFASTIIERVKTAFAKNPYEDEAHKSAKNSLSKLSAATKEISDDYEAFSRDLKALTRKMDKILKIKIERQEAFCNAIEDMTEALKSANASARAAVAEEFRKAVANGIPATDEELADAERLGQMLRRAAKPFKRG